MPKRLAQIASSLRQLGEIQVTDWDFMALLNKDIKDLEIGPSLRKLGNKKVMDWDFRAALPAVHGFVHQEVDVVGWVKRAAGYKVLDWDFRSALADEGEPASDEAPGQAGKIPTPREMEELVLRLRNFLQFVVVNLIGDAGRAEIRVQEIAPRVVRFRLLVTRKDLKEVLGRDGATASSIRNLLKGTAEAQGVSVLLEFLSHEEQRSLRETADRQRARVPGPHPP